MTKFEDLPQVKRSRLCEKRVSTWLQKSRGAYVLPVYDYSGLDNNKAPKLSSLTKEPLILPDLFCSLYSKPLWVEVKLKTEATFTRITQRDETGISLKLWNHYIKVKEVTGIEVHLMFVHERECEMRGLELEEAKRCGPRIYDGQKMGYYGMIFFPYRDLIKYASLSELKDLDIFIKD